VSVDHLRAKQMLMIECTPASQAGALVAGFKIAQNIRLSADR